MKPETADQDELQRMLALKRHEQPPQKFFKGLSSAVIDRIQNPEPPPPPTFWQRLGLDIDAKPVLVCLSGAAVFALLTYGLIRARDAQPPAPTTDENVSGVSPHLAAGGPLEAATPSRLPPTKAGEPPRSLEPVKVNTAGDRMAVQPRPAPKPAGNGGN